LIVTRKGPRFTANHSTLRNVESPTESPKVPHRAALGSSFCIKFLLMEKAFSLTQWAILLCSTHTGFKNTTEFCFRKAPSSLPNKNGCSAHIQPRLTPFPERAHGSLRCKRQEKFTLKLNHRKVVVTPLKQHGQDCAPSWVQSKTNALLFSSTISC